MQYDNVLKILHKPLLRAGDLNQIITLEKKIILGKIEPLFNSGEEYWYFTEQCFGYQLHD